ncbi:hypothetical protein P43SY_000903 [Pythium insidiosum]|uniref:Myb/SANT-like domain-containing protein n=1 Tax=Pythium insidiosum TaxID=114742 RepID=A0AAD5Q589_PYTIN|nr:hypothetical protein P43SY_000903 [Pythium insidiosum]
MVLFSEAETLLLLDLYLHYRSNPQNLTSGGVLLKMHARDELSRAMNKCFKRSTPWSESQVTVKFKNLRSEYIELKWLAEQPGFHPDGHGMNDAWWADIKSRRPKVHAFKGKLPWPFYKKMAVIVGDLPASTIVTDSRNLQLISQLLSELAADATMGAALRASMAQPPAALPAGAPAPAPAAAPSPVAPSPDLIAVEATENGAIASVATAAALPPRSAAATNGVAASVASFTAASQVPPALPHVAGTVGALGVKRPRDVVGTAARRPRRRLSEMTDSERERQQVLAKSVEQGSRAAADMAKGFYELVTVFNQQVEKCMQLEKDDGGGGGSSSSSSSESAVVADERQILSSLAASLAKSANATAEMARGYSDLVAIFIQESEDATAAFTV